MAYDPGAIDTNLAAAVGDEPQLIADLRFAFTDGTRRAFTAMEAAVDEDSWRAAAARLKGLAASFGAIRLMTLAGQAAAADPHDPMLTRRLRRAIERL